MSRSAEYQQFLDLIEGRREDDLGPEEETTASPQEIGWWKKHQIRRAIHHARYGVATSVELHLLKEHGIVVSPHAKERSEEKEA